MIRYRQALRTHDTATADLSGNDQSNWEACVIVEREHQRMPQSS